MIQNNTIQKAANSFNQSISGSLKIKCVFFDMDGVLFNSMPYHAESWIKTFAEFGLELPEHEPYMNEGSTALYTVSQMFKKYQNQTVSPETAEAIKKRKHEIMASMPQSEVLEPMPQLVDLVRKQGLDRWVVTGSAQEGLIGRLNAAYNGNFERHKMVTAHDVKQGKPHPEPYLQAMEKSGFGVHNSLVIENAPLGVESAKAAGLFTIAVNTGPLDPKVLADAGADIVLNSTIELFNYWPALIRFLK